MAPKLIELRARRELLEPEFNGYKLSLEDIPVLRKEFLAKVDRALPAVHQYSLLHAKLFGLHNHLLGEVTATETAVYFINELWCVQKVYVENTCNSLSDSLEVWQIPNRIDRQSGDYNTCLRFLPKDLAVVSDGTGYLYLLNTGPRENNDHWIVAYSGEVLGPDKRFVIQDVRFKEVEGQRPQIVLLLLSIEQEAGEHFVNLLHWITLKKSDDGSWGLSALRELKGKGELHYCFFDESHEALCAVSENGLKFQADSENPIVDKKETEKIKKKYMWTQTKEDIVIQCKLPNQFDKKNVKFTNTKDEICVSYNNDTFLSGKLHHLIEEDLTTWTTSNEILEINLVKVENGLMWPEVVENDDAGEYVIDTELQQEINRSLEQLTSDTGQEPQSGTTFNNQQVEDCDLVDEKLSVLERINCSTHDVSHCTYLGTHPVLLIVKLHDDLPPALGLRHDVDVCLWQPQGAGDNWNLTHEGTLLAFGYVQASKQQKKFLAAAPDLSYAVVCESSRHIFIYCQNIPVTSGQLRNRTTGTRVNSIAQQKVITVPGGEILGVYTAKTDLFVLIENEIFNYKM